MKFFFQSIFFSIVLSFLLLLIINQIGLNQYLLYLIIFLVIYFGIVSFYLIVNQSNNKFEELKKPFQNEKKSLELLQDLSHEMKTPLFSIQGYIETLIDGAIEDKSVRSKYLKSIAKASERLISLISDLDKIHEYEKDEILLHYSSFNLIELVEEVFDLVNFQAKENNVILRKSLLPKIVYVYADKNKILQVILNLVSNAILYSNEASLVQISFTEKSTRWKITISDTGIGIPKEDLKHIFNRFYRVDKSRNRKTGGSGLGLTIVKKILQAHNKDIFVESVLGEGTTFYFELEKS